MENHHSDTRFRQDNNPHKNLSPTKLAPLVDDNDDDSNADDNDWCMSDDVHDTSAKVSDDSGGKNGQKQRVPEDIRLRINSRERQRMHDLNSALDSLRQVGCCEDDGDGDDGGGGGGDDGDDNGNELGRR